MKKPPKVTAAIERRQVTIDNDTGEAQVEVRGKFKGFGKGFRDYVMGSSQEVALTTNTGAYPAGHEHAGKWAVQMIVGPLDSEEAAAALADKLTPAVEKEMRRPVPAMPRLPKR